MERAETFFAHQEGFNNDAHDQIGDLTAQIAALHLEQRGRNESEESGEDKGEVPELKKSRTQKGKGKKKGKEKNKAEMPPEPVIEKPEKEPVVNVSICVFGCVTY